jgi:glycosyltransferase involved in cell wall biosynthesis
MKILMVSSYLPFPLRSGGHIRLYNLIKNLSEKNDITLICEKRDFQTDEDIEEVEKICKKVLTVRRKKQWSPSNILKTGISKDPFLVVGHTSDEMKQLIRDELVRENYDLIHVETFYVYQNLPKVSIPVVLVEHNIEYLVYERFAKRSSSFLKPFFYLDVIKLKQKETEAWRKADRLVAVSNIERRYMKRADVDVVPNGVNTEEFKFRNFQEISAEKRILFIGDFKWVQNRDALEFILKEIWPNIIEKVKELDKRVDIKLWVVGKNIPSGFKNYASENIIFDEDNKLETPEIFRRSYLLLAPLRVAGGTSYKIIEAMASGTAVVTTNLGIEGLEAKNGVQVIACENQFDLADSVCNLISDNSLYKRLTLNARKFIEEKYDWKIISDKLNEVYKACI